MGLSRAPHLHEDLEAVQRGGACPGHGTCHCTCHQLLPPHVSQLLLLRELIWDCQALTNVQDLGMQKLRVSCPWGGVSPMNPRTPIESLNESHFKRSVLDLYQIQNSSFHKI